MKDPLDVIVIGDSGQDIFLVLDPKKAHLEPAPEGERNLVLTYGAKLPILAKYDTVGGNAANAATALSRLGLETALYTHVGGDDTGERICREFRRNAIREDYVVVDRHLESNYNTILSFNGDRTILSYHCERAYELPRLASAPWVYLSSMRKGCEVLYPDLEDYLDETGAKLYFQPGTYQLAAGRRSLAGILKRTEIIALNKEEAADFVGLPADTACYLLLTALHKLGPKVVLITDGKKGATVSDGEQAWHLGVIDEVVRLDTTGAGDAFASAFMAAVMHDLPLTEALRWGQGESSSVIQKFGAQAGLLHRRQLSTLLNSYPDLVAKHTTGA